MKKRILFYLLGLLFAVISALSIPMVLRIICCLIPLLFYGYSTVLGYLSRLARKSFFNEYLIALAAAFVELISLKFVYAAMTLIFFDAIVYFFGLINTATKRRIAEASVINLPTARILQGGKTKIVPAEKIERGNTVVLSDGDVIPVDGIITNGSALIDYSNLFGSGEFVSAGPSKFCYSGGIVQKGNAFLSCEQPFKNSYSALVLSRTKSAHKPSLLHKKTSSRGFAVMLLFIVAAIITFIVSVIITKAFAKSVNYFSVMLVLSSSFALLNSTSFLYHNTIVNIRMHGASIRSEQTIDSLSEIEAISPSSEIDPSLRNLLEAEGIVMGDNAAEQKITFLYRSKESLRSSKNHCFKVALGFFDSKADMTIHDGNPVRLLDVIKASKNFKTVLLENIAIVAIEKILVLLLLFIFNIHATDAMILEFAAAVACVLNSSKFLS